MQAVLDYPNLNHVIYLPKVVTIITTYRLNEHNINFTTVTVIKLRTPSSQQGKFPVISAAHKFKVIVAIIINRHKLDYSLQFHQVRRYAGLDVLVGIKKLLPNVTSWKISRSSGGTNNHRTFLLKRNGKFITGYAMSHPILLSKTSVMKPCKLSANVLRKAGLLYTFVSCI
jgi:hypothetical protein